MSEKNMTPEQELENSTLQNSNDNQHSAADELLRQLAKMKGESTTTSTVSEQVTATVVEKTAPVVEKTETVVEKTETVEPITELSAAIPAELAAFQEASEEMHEEQLPAYNTMTKEQLVAALKELISNKPVTAIKSHYNAISDAFKHIADDERAAKRQAFIEAGGVAQDFKFEPDAVEKQYRELVNLYHTKRQAHEEQQEKQKQHNLQVKTQLINELRDLVARNDAGNKSFAEFHELQKRWRETGPVPQGDVKLLWENYHYHVENFYKQVKINKELRDLDFKRNLDEKVKVCEDAEGLMLEESAAKAFKTLQRLHARWGEIGPVPFEKKEEVWERFKLASGKVNKKYYEHLEVVKREQENNLNAKTLLCEKIEEINQQEPARFKEWEERSQEVMDTQKMWKLIGYTPRKDSQAIYDRFRKACDAFFEKKRTFFNKSKEELNQNMQLKTDLCIQAESLKDSADWKKTTEIFVEIQKKWKQIGPVPRKHSDELWDRFRAACNYFFEQKKNHFDSIDKEQEDNLRMKRELIERVNSYVASGSSEQDLDALKAFQKEWTEIGHVPFKQKDEVQHRFREAVDKQFEKLESSDGKRSEMQFMNKLESLKNLPTARKKINVERDKIIHALDKLEGDIKVWENNIGFFAKSKNSEAMVKEFNQKIEDSKQKADELRQQLKMIDSVK